MRPPNVCGMVASRMYPIFCSGPIAFAGGASGVMMGHQKAIDTSSSDSCCRSYSHQCCIDAVYGPLRCQPKNAPLTASNATMGLVATRSVILVTRGSATALGFPVALKASGPGIVHKTEVGGVALGLHDAAEVREAYT